MQLREIVKALSRLKLFRPWVPRSSQACRETTAPPEPEPEPEQEARSADRSITGTISNNNSNVARHQHSHQVTSSQREGSLQGSRVPNTSQIASSAASSPPGASIPASVTAAGDSGSELLFEKHLYISEFELSTSSSVGQLRLPPAAADPAPDQVDSPASPPLSTRSPSTSATAENEPKIMHRKIWVKRPGASATLVTVQDDDLVDTVRDVILEKYRNSLGRSVDSPDISLRLVSRETGSKSLPIERTLGPDEAIGRVLDAQYPGGQKIDDALLIDIPQRRTPKPSPRVGNHHHALGYPIYLEDHRPREDAREYFPPMAAHSPHLSSHQAGGAHLPHSMAVVTTGQLPALPSPGGHSTRKHRDGRPKYVRQHTSSPTILHSSQPHSNDLKSSVTNGIATAAPLPTPPPPSEHRPSLTPPNRASSPHQGPRSKRKGKPPAAPHPAKSSNGDASASKPPNAGLLDGKVPPINVLIVEDNPINLRLLEQFMKRLKVRWKTAMNGREAVDTWKTGGFHLVLMDIQLPVMSGLEATKEIRRLESVNGIGLGLAGGQAARGRQNGDHEITADDRLADMSLFKSPVIIVALTASSLQSDRHEALAVGCNDFLTKPVGFTWMLKKVTEWGCMQALIDFDGWRQWKASAEKQDQGLTDEQKKARDKDDRAKRKAQLTAMFSAPPPTTRPVAEREEVKGDAAGRSPVNGTGPPRRIARGGSGSATLLETHAEESEE